MEVRNPKKVAFYTVISGGIYSLYWLAKTRDEIQANLENKPVPSLWWFILPFGSYWWMWLYAETLEETTNSTLKRNDTFLLFIITTLAGTSFSQFDFGGTLSIEIFLVVLLIAVALSLAIYSIFPAVMQNKFNKLASTTKNTN